MNEFRTLTTRNCDDVITVPFMYLTQYLDICWLLGWWGEMERTKVRIQEMRELIGESA